MTDYFDVLEDLLEDAEKAAGLNDAIDKARAENRVLGDACDAVGNLSSEDEMSETQVSSLAGQLSDRLDNYNKTNIKQEIKPHFSEPSGEGKPFDELVEDRLDSLTVVHSTDHKQSTVWRWKFSDGVQLETEASADGGREHHAWPDFKEHYFDELVALGKGERIAKPTDDRRGGEGWKGFINDLILEHAESVEHVGPRTEAVRLLRDYVERSAAYCEMGVVRERQGVWIDVDSDGEEAAIPDGGAVELRIPFEHIQRTCDQTGITTRALQIELQARGLTHDKVNGVSNAEYVDGRRVPYWSLTTKLAEPDEVILDPATPAEKAAQRQAERLEEEQTSVGAVEDEDSEDREDSGETSEPRDGVIDQPIDENDEEESEEAGLRNSFGTDPDEEGEPPGGESDD
jgi:hypothetical protein